MLRAAAAVSQEKSKCFPRRKRIEREQSRRGGGGASHTTLLALGIVGFGIKY